MPIDYAAARELVNNLFAQAESDLLAGTAPKVIPSLVNNCDVIFQSRTQAYREALLGCAIARIQDRDINIRLPYVDQGTNAFSGRSLDERVVNPFLQEKRVPSSRGPYLSVFRRSVRFDTSTRAGLRDKEGFDAFLEVIDYLHSISEDAELNVVLKYLLHRFVQMREAADVPVTRLQRISLEQYDFLISGLLSTPSGGRFPMLLVIAVFQAVKDFFRLNWDITC